MLRTFALLFATMIFVTAARAEPRRDCASDNHETAIRACTQLIKQSPRDSTLYYNRGISYRATGRMDLALADYNRAIELNPNYFEALNNRGTIYMARRDNQRALQDFDAAVRINPRYPIGHNNRGEAYENMNQLENAMAAYNRAIEFNPRYARAYANRGDIWRKMKNRENAVADYRHALSIDPNNSLATEGLRILGAVASGSGPGSYERAAPAQPEAQRAPPQTALAPSSPSTAPASRSPNQPPAQERSSSGTGFFVSNDGHVLTNHHVVENCRTISISLNGSLAQSARVIARDAKNDLALLKAAGLAPATVPNLRMGVRLGENVYVYGFPLAGLLASTGNFTIGNVTAVAGLGDDTTMIQMSAPVQPGNSGGPVFDERGNVVAVVVSKLNALRIAKVTNDIPQNVNFAIKSSIAMSFLETGSISASTSPSTARLETTQIADQARAFTAQVSCN